MTNFVCIADDLTGANANCSLMKKIGLDTASLFDASKGLPEGYGFTAFTTDSRGLAAEEAYRRVKGVLDDLNQTDGVIYSKRTDSTLRGNLGSELNAFFDYLGEDYMGIAVPAYPATNRVVLNGTMLVNGELLINSDAGRDTKTPVFSSNVLELFENKLNYKASLIKLEDVEKGSGHISNLILKKQEEGVRLLVFDGITDTHLEIIAEGVLLSGVKFFSADPGPFSMEIASQVLQNSETLSKVLMVVGSVTDISVRQIRKLLAEYDIRVLEICPSGLINPKKRDEEIQKISEEGVKLLEKDDILLLTTTPYKDSQKRLDLVKISEELNLDIDELAVSISTGIAAIAQKIITSDNSFAGAFMSGGDITTAFLKEMDSVGIEVREEIIPLAAYGRIIGGHIPRFRIISKGGMVGDDNAMKVCLERLKKE